MEHGFRLWANPSSPHAEGRKAREALEEARARVKAALGWEGEVIFTSGASEAAALALTGAKVGIHLVSVTEHDAVMKAAPDAERLPVQADGVVSLDVLGAAIQRDLSLVALQQLNSETGVIQPLDHVSIMVREAGGLLLADCSQSAGKFKLPDADMVIISAHKLGGPVGIGALLVRDFAILEPAGGQERGYRRGTENLPGALGFAAALESRDLRPDPAHGDEGVFAHTPAWMQQLCAPLADLMTAVDDAGGLIVPQVDNDELFRADGTILAIAMPGMSGSAQLMRFDMAGIAVSQGSACSSGTMKRSHVLEAMQLDPDISDRTIRVSFGWTTTREEVERFCEVWLDMAHQ